MRSCGSFRLTALSYRKHKSGPIPLVLSGEFEPAELQNKIASVRIGFRTVTVHIHKGQNWQSEVLYKAQATTTRCCGHSDCDTRVPLAHVMLGTMPFRIKGPDIEPFRDRKKIESPSLQTTSRRRDCHSGLRLKK